MKLDELIEEALVDAYGDSEQLVAFEAVLHQDLELPFTTEVLGAAISVVAVELTGDEVMVAVCQRGRARQRIPLLELALPSTPPRGIEWLHAFRRWRRPSP
jgi:hypothetical protein